MTTTPAKATLRIVLPLNFAAPVHMNDGTLRTCSGVVIGGALNRQRPDALPSADVVGELNRRSQLRLLGPRISTPSLLDRVVERVVRPIVRFC